MGTLENYFTKKKKVCAELNQKSDKVTVKYLPSEWETKCSYSDAAG